jgi:thiol-disulfide isomerase/thioredoxin
MSSSIRAAGGTKKFWTPSRVIATLAVLSLIAAFGVSSCNSTDESAKDTSAKPPVVKQPAAPNTAPPAVISLTPELREASLNALDGPAVKLSDYAGKVLIVNLWATWCGPCKAEMPDLVNLSKVYKSRGLEVIGVATKQTDPDPEKVREFVREENISYKIIWDDGNFATPLVQMVQGRNVIPQSFVISRDGKIVKYFSGFSVTQTPPKMRQAVEEALNDKGA